MRGVFWRRYLVWAVRNIPWTYEPMAMVLNSIFFFVVWNPGRRAVTRNLCAIFPHHSRFRNRLRAFRVFLSFAWTFTDTTHFNERRMQVDWEFEGLEHLQALGKEEGAIILTAHMGNYDLGSYLFAEMMKKQIVVVRLPELDPESEEFSRTLRERSATSGYRVNYNLDPGTLALTLVEALRNGEIVAIQGDRWFEGIPAEPVDLFGVRSALPAGPFALAIATGVPIYPLFVVRTSRRRYRVITHPPFHCRRDRADRKGAIMEGIDRWKAILEQTVRQHWHQWHTFEPFAREETR